MVKVHRVYLEIRCDELLFNGIKSVLISGDQDHPLVDGLDGNRMEKCV